MHQICVEVVLGRMYKSSIEANGRLQRGSVRDMEKCPRWGGGHTFTVQCKVVYRPQPLSVQQLSDVVPLQRQSLHREAGPGSDSSSSSSSPDAQRDSLQPGENTMRSPVGPRSEAGFTRGSAAYYIVPLVSCVQWKDSTLSVTHPVKWYIIFKWIVIWHGFISKRN